MLNADDNGESDAADDMLKKIFMLYCRCTSVSRAANHRVAVSRWCSCCPNRLFCQVNCGETQLRNRLLCIANYTHFVAGNENLIMKTVHNLHTGKASMRQMNSLLLFYGH